jgi:L-threonylcarbamoyladenylate synthase
MNTQVLSVDSVSPSPDALRKAADVLRRGGLVAFPTETVYGLGANALDATAAAGIFAAKGRPANNPLIVHTADLRAARELAAEWPDAAERLATRFWPGPLSLVVPKRPHIPDIVTAGGATVALRVPANLVARALLVAAGVPIAAPSANRSNRISPTCAEHVLRSLDGRIDLLLDGGSTSGGLESTVVDVSRKPARLLRPGLLTREQLQEALGEEVLAVDSHAHSRSHSESTPLPSPGMLSRHYAPTVPLECISGHGWQRVQELCRNQIRVGWLAWQEEPLEELPGLIVTRMPLDPAGYSAELYAAMYRMEGAGVDRIVVSLPPSAPEWLAVHDRLRRASAK